MRALFAPRLEGRTARVGIPTLVSLALCAASAAAALAHYAIDIVGDYALPHDTYDGLSHASRELLSGVALLAALALARRGLRACFEIATSRRGNLPAASFSLREWAGFVLAAFAGTAAFVPAMEWLDGCLAGVPVRALDDAFGGSILLGLATTVICAALVASLIYAIAFWLVSHRDDIVAIIVTLCRRSDAASRPCGRDLERGFLSPRRRRTAHALRLCKRGPPGIAPSLRHYHFTSTEGDSREIRSPLRDACAARARRYVRICRAGWRATYSASADRAPRQHRRNRRRRGQRRPAPRRHGTNYR
jgi:hypothetical protein